MIDFVCMANEAYRHWVELCVRAIERRHPQSKIHLFDLSEARENRLRESFGSRGQMIDIDTIAHALTYPRHPLGQPIEGTQKNVDRFARRDDETAHRDR